ncbi:hypothetical protein BDN72DRAFT_608394 [Pluteus cervinus]|uniref:Uncharacterized protein n=1 Tax=Pluteus cervinus TaxID=181527 RepID=A0ACD3AX80_9AGAR|nr:hypothetical protein BDN72DRAFT_608394 [Pluteus cervinus]
MTTANDDQLLGIVDAEIAQLRLRLSALCSKRNALMPVARLPPELMSIIFLYARDSRAPNSRSKMVLIISWICRTWRRNSLNFSQLWSEIDFHHHMGIKKFLTRSRQSPLSIKLNYSYLVLRDILGLPQCSRIQSFDLNKDSFVEKRPRHLDLD